MSEEKKISVDEATAEEIIRPPILISVNEQPVKMLANVATGAEIKARAIEAGVHIQPNFMLMEELPNGTSRKIGDNDEVKLRPHMKFTAIAPDDNS